jgi:fibronectin-binding autotransporter adhesin
MKNRLTKLKSLIVLCSTVLATAAFGQVTQIFDGHSLTNLPLPAITNVDTATNYVGGVAPNAGNGDTAEFDGLLPGPLSLGYNGGWQSGPGASGVTLHMTANQTNSIYIDNLAALPNPPNFAINGIQLDSGAGALTIGSDSLVFNYAGRPGGANHQVINNSTNLVKIGSGFHMIAGGGSPFTFDFMGTGDFLIKTFLVTDNTPNNNTTFTVDTTGTVTWSPTPAAIGYLNAVAAVNVNSGLLIMTTNHPKIGNTPFLINGAFRFNAPGALQNISGAISGSGVLQVSNGTLSLSSTLSTFGGTNLLSGGTLIVNGAETVGSSGPLGSGGVISFAGGTLAYSVNNSFDYSARFDTAAGQLYSIDTAGQTLAFSNALTSAGGSFTKLGAGTLTLAGANTFTGPTTINGGKLVIQRSSGTGAITVADGAALGITENDSQIKPSTLTLGTTAGVVLEFNNVTNKTTPSLVAGTISAAGPVTININSGVFGTIGQTYPLFSWTSGSAPAVTLGSVSGAAGALSTNGNTIVLTITSTPYVWTGGASGAWDKTTSGNWVQSGNPVTFTDGVLALLDDTAAGTRSLTISGLVQPVSITVDNDGLPYSIASSPGNFIGGSGGLTMNGNGLLTLSGGANTNSGGTVINSGTVSVGVLANGGAPSDIGSASNSPAGLVLNGGVLQYTGPAVDIDRQFTLGSSGGTLDSSGTGALRLTNNTPVALSGTGPRTLTLTGTLADTNTLTANVANSSSGATALSKSGPGTWILTGTNAYSGLTTINNGVLQIGVGGGNGTIGTGPVDNNRGLDFNRSGTLTVSGAISGTGAVTNDGPGTVILAANNSYSGGTVINAGTVQIGTGGTSGSLNVGSQVIDNGTIVFNSKTPITISGFGANISGTGNVRIVTGTLKATGNNSYTGWTEIDSGATFQPSDGNSGIFSGVGSVITNNGTIFMTRQDAFVFGISNNIVGTGKLVVDTGNQNSGLVNLAGTNTYTGGTFIGGSGIVLGDGVTPNAGTILGNVVFTNTTGPSVNTFSQNKMLVFDYPGDFTFTNAILSRVSDGSSAANSGSVVQMGPGVLTLAGVNNYPGSTIVGTGTLRVGTGGTIGNIGTGDIVLTNNGTLIMNRSDSVTINGLIRDDVANGNGFGTFVQAGPGTVTLTATNTGTGPTTVSNGTLVVNSSVGGDLNVYGGTLVAGGAGVVGSLHVAGIMNIAAGGTLSVAVNKTLAVSNTLVTVDSGSINATGGTLNVADLGPSLAVGDRFVLFNAPVTGGNSLAVVSTFYTFNNNLAVDGSISVASIVQPAAPKINNVSLSGTNIVISATNNAGTGGGSYTLFGTNNLTAPLSTWPIISTGTFDNSGNLFLTNAVKNGANFFILRVP